MKKDNLRYILRTLVRDLENLATSEQITKFKEKYKGMDWQKTLENDILEYANTAVALERWIGNVIAFMVEHGIAKEGKESRDS